MKSMKSILIIGLGHFGISLVGELAKGDSDVVVIEENQIKADSIKELVDNVIVADATSKELLEKFAKDVDCAIVCLSEKIDSSVLITFYLKQLGVKKVIAKATSKDHGRILQSIGADEVIFPEEETAKRLARSLVSPDILDAIHLSEEFDIIEIPAPEKFVKQTIKGLQLRNKYEIDILAVKNPLMDQIKIMPPPEYEFRPDDVIIFIGGVGSMKRLENL